jgi:REP element-mobilizing transposase RayT
MKAWLQTDFVFRTHGGPRLGAGRPQGDRESHDRRPVVDKYCPQHITLRAVRGAPNLRAWTVARVIGTVLKKIAANPRYIRVTHFSIQRNHMHFIVESPEGNVGLARGMQRVTAWIARAVNRRLGRKGSLFGDRYHAEELSTPTHVKNAIVYVLHNHKHHGYRTITDDRSSAAWFDFCDRPPRRLDAAPVSRPSLWLLTSGLRRQRISIHDHPKS